MAWARVGVSLLIIITGRHRALRLIHHHRVCIVVVLAQVPLLCLLLVCRQVSIVIWRHLLMLVDVVRLVGQVILRKRLHHPRIHGACSVSLLMLSRIIHMPVDSLRKSISHRRHVETTLLSRCLRMGHVELVGKGVLNGDVRLLVLLLKSGRVHRTRALRERGWSLIWDDSWINVMQRFVARILAGRR